MPGGIGTPGGVINDFVSIPDLAATFLVVRSDLTT
jgi:hypothetical protein